MFILYYFGVLLSMHFKKKINFIRFIQKIKAFLSQKIQNNGIFLSLNHYCQEEKKKIKKRKIEKTYIFKQSRPDIINPDIIKMKKAKRLMHFSALRAYYFLMKVFEAT